LTAGALIAAAWTPITGASDVPPGPGPRAAASIAALAIGPEAIAIHIDGELNDAVWANAPLVSGFVQRTPSEGAAATRIRRRSSAS